MKRAITLLFAVALMAAACGDDQIDISAGADPDPSPDRAIVDPPLGGGPYPIGTLEFTVSQPEKEEIVYVISCLGDTATLTGQWSPSDQADTIGNLGADQMCLRLGEATVQARLTNGEPVDQICTEIYGGDDSAIVTGEIDGRPVDTNFHRNNGCGIHDWDTVMMGLLPPSRGA